MTPSRWIALALAMILTAYWARVIEMARKQRRRTGHGANFVPPERLGRAIRVVWYPLVVAWVAHPFITASRDRGSSLLEPLLNSQALALVGVLLAGAALAGSRVCWNRMGKSWRMGIDPNEKTELIVTGPFAYVRHPIYALSSLLMIASVMTVPSPLMLGLALVHLACLQWEARREERYLLSLHGEEYAAYRARVGGFLPRFGARS